MERTLAFGSTLLREGLPGAIGRTAVLPVSRDRDFGVANLRGRSWDQGIGFEGRPIVLSAVPELAGTLVPVARSGEDLFSSFLFPFRSLLCFPNEDEVEVREGRNVEDVRDRVNGRASCVRDSVSESLERGEKVSPSCSVSDGPGSVAGRESEGKDLVAGGGGIGL